MFDPALEKLKAQNEALLRDAQSIRSGMQITVLPSSQSLSMPHDIDSEYRSSTDSMTADQIRRIQGARAYQPQSAPTVSLALSEFWDGDGSSGSTPASRQRHPTIPSPSASSTRSTKLVHDLSVSGNGPHSANAESGVAQSKFARADSHTGIPVELVEQIEKALALVSMVQQIRERQEQELLEASITGKELRHLLDKDREKYSRRFENLGRQLHEEQVQADSLRAELHELRLQEASALEDELNNVRLEARQELTCQKKPEHLVGMQRELAHEELQCQELEEHALELSMRTQEARVAIRPLEEQLEMLNIVDEQSAQWRSEEAKSHEQFRELHEEIQHIVRNDQL